MLYSEKESTKGFSRLYRRYRTGRSDRYNGIQNHIYIEDEISTQSLCILITKRRAIDYTRKKDNHTLQLADVYVEDRSEIQYPDILLDHRATVDIIVKAISELDDIFEGWLYTAGEESYIVSADTIIETTNKYCYLEAQWSPIESAE